jgi:Na+/H+-dicarboxylate symporter
MSDLADALCIGLVVGNLLRPGDGLKFSMGEPILHAVEHLQRPGVQDPVSGSVWPAPIGALGAIANLVVATD